MSLAFTLFDLAEPSEAFWRSWDGFDAVSPETIVALIVVLSVMAMLLAVAVVQSAIDWRARRVLISAPGDVSAVALAKAEAFRRSRVNQGTSADASQPSGHPGTGCASASAVALRAMADTRANKARGRG